MKDLLTTSEVAEIIGVSNARVRQLVLAKILPAQKFGHINLVKKEDLKLLADRKNGRPRKTKEKAA